MDQSTERLLKTSINSDSPLFGISNTIDSAHSSPPPYIYDAPSPSTSSPDPSVFITDNTAPSFALGPYRTRHLSCILENWSESESYNSLPIESTTQKNDDSFAGLLDHQKPMSWEAEDVTEYITTLDESCILDIESIEEIDQIPKEQQRHSWTSSTVHIDTINKHKNVHTLQPNHLQPQHHHHHHHQTQNNRQQTQSRQTNKYVCAATSITNLSNKNISHSTDSLLYGTNVMIKSGGPVEKYPKIMTTSCYGALSNNPFSDGKLMISDDIVHRSTDELLLKNNNNFNEDFLYLNPPVLSNQPKCRSPLPVSLSSSYCDGGTTSMNNSFYEQRSMQSSVDLAGCGSSYLSNSAQNAGELPKTTINPLELSMISQDGTKLQWDETIPNLKELVDNGEYLFIFLYYVQHFFSFYFFFFKNTLKVTKYFNGFNKFVCMQRVFINAHKFTEIIELNSFV